jgi:predicted ATPase
MPCGPTTVTGSIRVIGSREAELFRLRGELRLHNGHASQAWPLAEADFRRAVEIARRQEARSLELRAALSLARLDQRRKQGDAGLQALAETLASFPEAASTPDLREARQLLGGEVPSKA